MNEKEAPMTDLEQIIPMTDLSVRSEVFRRNGINEKDIDVHLIEAIDYNNLGYYGYFRRCNVPMSPRED